MSAKKAFCDQDVMDFQDLYGSPAKSEASSVDLYDGLDMSVTVPDETTKPSSPSRDCLDLYEEIIAEEGTAKEASFNNLNTEYEKCQKQMQQLISKLKDMQCLNNNLQNENQCLKKNISALIKTARVELTRKEDEINRLNQRLCVPGSYRSYKSDPAPLLSINTKLKNKELSQDTINKTSILRKEAKPQGTSAKDPMSNDSSTKNYSEQAKPVENNSESTSKMEQKQCKENEGTEKQPSRHKLMVDKKSKKDIDSDGQSRVVDRRQRSEGHRSSLSTVADDDRVCEIKEQSHGQPTKTGKSERSQEIRNSKKSDVDYKVDSRKHSSNSHDKPSFSKENTRGQELPHSKEKHLKTHENPEHRKESKGYERDKTVVHRTNEKDDASQRLKRTQSSSIKNEYSQKSSPSEQNVGKGIIESDRRDKRCSEYSDSKNISKDSKSSKTEVRPSSSKNKYKCDSKGLTERDIRTEKKSSKNEDNIRSDQNHRGHRKEEKARNHSSNKVKMQDCPSRAEVKSQNFAKGSTCQREDNSAKDLKLSFMETLNLTLSPAKKKSQDSESANSPVSAGETDMNSIYTGVSSKVCTSTNDGTDSHEYLSKPNSMDLTHSTKMSVENPTSSDELKLVHHSEPVEDTVAVHEEQLTMTIKKDKALTEATQSNVDCPHVLHMEPEANLSDDLDTQSILNESDFIVLDSYVETDKCSSKEITPENLNLSVPAENVQDNGVILPQISEDADQTNGLKPNITGSTKGICESSNTDQCLHDESSVISLDLNFLRRIPKVVSPLKSPARPLAHLPTTECTTKASVVSVSYKDLPSDVNISTPNELNKENCEPVSKTDIGSETFPIEISSDEVEEGEIVSDEEPDNEQSSQSKSSPSQTKPIKDTIVSKSPESQERKMASLTKPNGVISPLRQSTSKTKEKKGNTKAKLLALPVDKGKNVTADSCLEGVLQIVPPSNIQDVLQMLRIIRKHIRKKYMKFKIQFPLTQFHRFVDTTSLCFTTLANRLDLSRLCSSPDKLQKKMCKLIESRLKQLKKNGIVDRIFEQGLIDMKKRLWKFVEEQLDSLFDILKGLIIKLCDESKLEDNQDENKISTLSKKAKKSDQIKSQKVNKTSKAKASQTKSENERCLRRLDFQYQRDGADTKPQTTEDHSVEKKRLKDLSTTSDKNGISPNPMSPKLKMPPSSTAKPDTSNECQMDQQSSAGLSFNLVSDDHMGDIFKSLLNDADNLELNTLHENIWILDTPEKISTSSQKYDAVNSFTEIKTPVKAAFPWTCISPPHINTLPRHETILTPDVFDESCLLEVPTSTSSSKSITLSEDRFKSYSVLMEDLAVSLTVPSPLKSDSHLSFLRPVCDPESISKINAHFSEDAVLDEEDATEQDIHLTLDSDNSNTDSMENSTEPDGFQCHPSEPMQAVIMEKSNDHFIVKIRRAVSSSSPVSDSSSVVESDIAATGQLESTHCYILDESLQKGIHTETKLKADTKNSLLAESTVPYSEELSFSKIDEKSENFTHVKPRTCSSPKTTHATISRLPDALNQSLTDTSEVELTNVLHTEKSQLDNEKLVTVCTEKNSKEDDKISVEQLIYYDKIETSFTEEIITSQTPCADTFLGSILEAESVDINPKKKKRKSSEQGPSAKRRNISCLSDKDKKEGSRRSKTEDQDKPLRKHRRAVSEGNANFTSFKLSPSGGISAKNVIKKKGEVVVSWTRNEDREILLECQQHGPNRKTFLALASKMSKYPHQVEERFRQLMKLFKKSRNSIS